MKISPLAETVTHADDAYYTQLLFFAFLCGNYTFAIRREPCNQPAYESIIAGKNMARCLARSILMLAALSMFFSPLMSTAQCQSAPGPLATTGTAVENDGPNIKVESIIFTGQTGLTPDEERDIVAAVSNKVGNYEPKWLEDLEAYLLDAWQERGYFKAEVHAQAREVSATPTEKTFVVTAQVESGSRYYLGEIRFLGTTQFSLQELRSLFPVQAGELFNTHRLQEGMAALRAAYGARGFIDLIPVPTTTADEAQGRISIEIELKEGRQFRISEAKIFGIDQASAASLLKSSGLEPGSIFNAKLLENFSQRHPLVKIELRIDSSTAAVRLQFGFPESSQAQPPQE